MTDETCGNCKFFRRVQPMQIMGTCHGRPPTLLLLGRTQAGQPVTDSFWPIVPETEFCGAFVRQISARAQALEHIDMSKLNIEDLEGSA